MGGQGQVAAQACHPSSGSIGQAISTACLDALNALGQCVAGSLPKAANQVVRFVYLVPQIGYRAVALPKLVAEPVPVKVPVVNVRHWLRFRHRI
jgi:hypothetical protein